MDTVSTGRLDGVFAVMPSLEDYQRPDLKVILEQLRRSRLRLRLAMSSDSAYRALNEFLAYWTSYQQTQDIAMLRHEQNTADPVFLAEAEFFAAAAGPVAISLTGVFQALLACRFRDDLVTRFDPDLLMVAPRLTDQVTERLREDLAAENLSTLQLHDWIAQARFFCLGQTWSLFALPSLLESPQRSIRRAALNGLDNFLQTHATRMDQFIDQSISLRQQIARKQRQETIRVRALGQAGLEGLTEETHQKFRNLVIQYFVPMSIEIRRLQRKRFGYDSLQDYDVNCLLPQGHPVPVFRRESLLTSAGALLEQLAGRDKANEKPENFHQLFSPQVADFMLKPDMYGEDLALHLHNSGETYWRLVQHGTMADIPRLFRQAGQLLGSLDWPVADTPGSTLAHPRLNDLARSSWQGYLTELATFGRLGMIIDDQELYTLLRLTQLIETVVWKALLDDFTMQVFDQSIADPESRGNLWLSLEKIYCPDIAHDHMPFLAKGGLMYLAAENFDKPFKALAENFGLVSALALWSQHQKSPARLETAWRKLVIQENRKPYFQLLADLGQLPPWDENLFKQLAYKASAALNL